MIQAIDSVGALPTSVPITGFTGSPRTDKGQQRVEHGPVAAKLTSDQASALVGELNETLHLFNTQLSFTFDKDSRRTILKVVDSNTHEVIRQIPPEDVLRVAERITKLLGVLYDEAG